MDNQNSDQSYKGRGYTEHFEKPFGEKKIPRLTSFDVDSYIQEISGNRLLGGIIYSKDKKLQINLDEGTVIYDDGITKTVIV
jgi:hypothetical protein